MLSFGRHKRKQGDAPDRKLARKLLGKDSGRKVFGFLCSPNIQAKAKILAGRLNMPIFALAEHEIEIGNLFVEKVIEDPEERELLLKHLKESHIDARTVEKIKQLDEKMGESLDAARIRRLEDEQVIKEIVIHCVRRGIRPGELPGLIYDGLKWRAVSRYNSTSKDTTPQV